MTPPDSSTASAPTSTIWQRDMAYATAACSIMVTGTEADASASAVECPSPSGCESATITEKWRVFAASSSSATTTRE